MIDLLDVRMFMHTFPDKFMLWLSGRVPRKLVYWCALRAAAYVTCGDYNDAPSDVDVMTMLKRIESWS